MNHFLTHCTVPSLPTIVLLGAPGTGAQTLSDALNARTNPGSARILCAEDLSGLPPAGAVDACLILLMGLDLPCNANERAAQEAADASLRAELSQAGFGYRVVYGSGEQRILNALNAIGRVAINIGPASAGSLFDLNPDLRYQRTARLRAWNCEKCSDPECEHRLFTALMGREADST